MAHYTKHAISSQKKFGGVVSDYHAVHKWMDESKGSFPGPLHRMLRHHTEGIWAAVAVFGDTITNSDYKEVPVTYILEQHLIEDFGFIPTFSDWCHAVGEAMDEGTGFPGKFRSHGPSNPGKITVKPGE